MIGKRHEYAAMAKAEKELWWYRSLHELTIKKIKAYSFTPNARILDAGCGTGGMLAYLKSKGYTNIEGFDLSSDAIEYANEYTDLNVRLLDILDSDKAYEKNRFDIVISNDILCLLAEPQDKIALTKLLSLLKPGGVLIMNLPANNIFKGTHDKTLNVLRRYSKSKITSLVGESAEIKESIYWPFTLSPLIFIVRFSQRIKMLFNKNENFLSDVKLPPAFLNKIFYGLISWENSFMKTKPWGSSVFVVMQKL